MSSGASPGGQAPPDGAEAKYNMKNPAVKRIAQEMREMSRDVDPCYHAEAVEDDIFEWHFAILGPEDTEFEGGIYHGRILLPPEYPFKPPSFMLLTPSGRFETNAKICLSISSHHPEHWQPSWSVRTALLAVRSFMPTAPEGAVGSLDYPADERRELAAASRERPPEFGNSESRRALIAEVHAKMLTRWEAMRAAKREREDVARAEAAAEAEDEAAAEGDAERASAAAEAEADEDANDDAAPRERRFSGGADVDGVGASGRGDGGEIAPAATATTTTATTTTTTTTPTEAEAEAEAEREPAAPTPPQPEAPRPPPPQPPAAAEEAVARDEEEDDEDEEDDDEEEDEPSQAATVRVPHPDGETAFAKEFKRTLDLLAFILSLGIAYILLKKYRYDPIYAAYAKHGEL